MARVAGQLLWVLLILCLGATRTQAQADEEVFLDPELSDVPAPTGTTVTSAAGEAAPSEPIASVRFVLRSRFSVDTKWEHPLEDVMEATQLGLLEATVRQSDTLRFEVGLRFTHFTDIREDDVPGYGQTRYEFDLAPTAGFVDWTMVDGLHLRAGFQMTPIGRFDVLGASDILSIKDFRKGPTAMPEMVDVAQLGVRLDWDASSWMSLSAYYLPFFQAHIMDFYGTDYALIPSNQVDLDGQMMDPNDFISEALTRSGQMQLSNAGIDAFTPDPDLGSPQGVLRMDLHGGAGELGVTLGTALEKLPAITMSESLVNYLQALATEEGPSLEDEARLAATPEPFRVDYNRYWLFGVDAARPVGPFLVGLEATFMLNRTLFAAEADSWPDPEQSHLITISARAEYTGSDQWLFALEGLHAHTLSTPSDPARSWLTLEQGRFFSGAVGMAGWQSPFGLRLELGGALFTGISYVLMPRAEYEIIEGFFAELGAYFVGGANATAVGAPDLALGGLYDGLDQVFIGVRWVP